jgi:hypothetical protein
MYAEFAGQHVSEKFTYQARPRDFGETNGFHDQAAPNRVWGCAELRATKHQRPRPSVEDVLPRYSTSQRRSTQGIATILIG